MTLYLRYDNIINETDKAFILLFSLKHVNELKKDFVFTTEKEETLSISEISRNFKFTLVIPKSVSDLYPDYKVISIPSWFYTKNLHNMVFKINHTDFVQFGKICVLWMRKTMPTARFTPDDGEVPLFSDTYSEIDLRDNSHLY